MYGWTFSYRLLLHNVVVLGQVVRRALIVNGAKQALDPLPIAHRDGVLARIARYLKLFDLVGSYTDQITVEVGFHALLRGLSEACPRL